MNDTVYSSRIGPILRRFPRKKLDLQVKAVATTLAPLEEIKESVFILVHRVALVDITI
jgi:hypothetical protein